MKFDKTIQDAVLQATANCSATAFAKKIGLSDTTILRFKRGRVAWIDSRVWNKLYPAISEFLPEGYRPESELFPAWQDKPASIPEPVAAANPPPSEPISDMAVDSVDDATTRMLLSYWRGLPQSKRFELLAGLAEAAEAAPPEQPEEEENELDCSVCKTAELLSLECAVAIKCWVARSGLTQADIARMLQVPVWRFSSWMQGRQRIPFVQIKQLIQILRMPQKDMGPFAHMFNCNPQDLTD